MCSNNNCDDFVVMCDGNSSKVYEYLFAKPVDESLKDYKIGQRRTFDSIEESCVFLVILLK